MRSAREGERRAWALKYCGVLGWVIRNSSISTTPMIPEMGPRGETKSIREHVVVTKTGINGIRVEVRMVETTAYRLILQEGTPPSQAPHHLPNLIRGYTTSLQVDDGQSSSVGIGVAVNLNSNATARVRSRGKLILSRSIIRPRGDLRSYSTYSPKDVY